tara:strand:- start:55 stop:384 length:330 start_codon:yes stop_codon:yes gene_type:complete
MTKLEYVLNNCWSYADSEELVAFRWCVIYAKSKNKSDRLPESIIGQLEIVDWKIDHKEFESEDSFKNWFFDFFLNKYEASFPMNYCPKCDSLARTPKAKQCYKCFHKWH